MVKETQPDSGDARSIENVPVGSPDETARFSVKRLLPLAVLGLASIGFFALGLDDYLTFETLHENRMLLEDFILDHMILAPAIFFLVYAAIVAFSFPGGAVMTIAAGFLFGTLLGTTFVVLSATAGAVAIFMAAKSSLGEPLRAKAGPWLKKFEAGFRKNAFNYLLVLRLVPLFPFFVVNLVPAFLGVDLRTYALTTLIGIIPGSFVFASVGSGLGSIFAMGGEISPADVLTPEVIVALVGLAVLSLLPVVYKAVAARRA